MRLVKQLNEPKLLTPSSAIQLPELVLPRVAHAKLERSQGHNSLVYVPEALRVEPLELKGLRTIATEEAVAQQLSVREGQFPQLREALAFAFHREPASAVLEIERRAPQITVRQLLTALIDSGVVKYKAQFQYEIRL